MIMCIGQLRIVLCRLLCIAAFLAMPIGARAAQVSELQKQVALPSLTAGALTFSHLTETPLSATATALPLDRAAVDALPQEQAMVPLPSGGKMGMAMLGLLALCGGRKSIARFVS